jgi:hypothetical protein
MSAEMSNGANVEPGLDARGERQGARGRRRIWECHELYFCPIAGFCLTLKEQRGIYAKLVKGAAGKPRAIDLHEFLVMGISKDNPIAHRVERMLDRKYADAIRTYGSLGYHEWIKELPSLLNPDDYGACIWISAAYQNFTLVQSAHVRARIHLYSHAALDELAACRREVLGLRATRNELYETCRVVKRKAKEAQSEIAGLRAERAELAANNRCLREQLAALRCERQPELSLRRETESLARRLEEAENLGRALRAENETLRKKDTETRRRIGSLRSEFGEILHMLAVQREHCDECDRVDLCHRRVLIVGGLTRMRAFYRELVERLGGTFDYHTGECNNGENGLGYRIQQADIVICPVDVNSHSACLEVKRSCKRANKPFHMLRKSSISSVYASLVESMRG